MLEGTGGGAVTTVGAQQNPADGTLTLAGPLSAAWPTSGLVELNVSDTETERGTISGTTVTMIAGGRAIRPYKNFTTAQTHPAGDPVTLIADWTAMQNMFPWKFDDQTLLSAAGSILIPASGSIPGTGFSLRIKLIGRGDTAAGNIALLLRFNGDNGGNYIQGAIDEANNAAVTGTVTAGQTAIRVGSISAATAPANYPGTAVIEVPGYSGTIFNKNAHGWTIEQLAATTGMEIYLGGGDWGNAAAITSVTLFPSAGNFITGTRCVTYID